MISALLLVLLQSADPLHPDDVLTGSVKTAHFVIRFRPGSRAEASVDRVMVEAERDRTRILERLEFPQFAETITLYLYDDEKELQKITKTPSAGVSITRTSHIPHDNDQTRRHELVHAIAEFLPEKGPEPRSLFFAEGIANATLEYVHGIHVNSVAAFELRRKNLPSLEEVHKEADFYGWLQNHPGVNGYDIAGSYILYLFETFGVKKSRRYYKGVPASEAFGKSLKEVEAGWHARLSKWVLRPGTEQLLLERAGLPAQFSTFTELGDRLTPEMLGPASAWRALSSAKAKKSGPGTSQQIPGGWKLEGPADSGDWTEAILGEETFTEVWVRCRAQADGRCFGVKLTLGLSCQAILLENGAFIYTEAGGVAHDPNVRFAGKSVEIVVRRTKERATVWVDSVKVLEAQLPKNAAPVHIGVVQGAATFKEISVRNL